MLRTMSLVSLWLVSLLTVGNVAVPALLEHPASVENPALAESPASTQDGAPTQNGTPTEDGTLDQSAGLSSGPASAAGLPSVPSNVAATLEERSLETLSALNDSRSSKLREIEQLRERFDPDENSERRLEQLEKMRKLQADLNTIQFNFEAVATGIDVRNFVLGANQEFDLISEVKGLLEPIVAELRDATEAPRAMERLRGQMSFAEEHQSLAREAVANLEELVKSAELTVENPEKRAELVAALRESQEGWRERVQELANQRTVAKFQLDQRESKQRSVLDSAQTALGAFFRSRGLNLLIALGVFLGTLFGLRLVHRAVSKLLGKKGKGERKFYGRLIDVLYFAFSGFAALGGALLVLYNASDWAILGLILLLLAGLAWAGKAAVPLFVEQIRLLLNLGTVREGERVIYQGLPWRVSQLSLLARLHNPELTGGRIRVPLRDMTALRSRRVANGESWFPTSCDDWVLVDGERLACVVFQSTEIVRLRMQGGSEVVYPTADFLGLALENLSAGFRIRIRFGIDYEHQAICTTQVPTLMREFLEQKLAKRFGVEHTRKVKLEFLEAGASSLDYSVMVDFAPGAAPAYNELLRGIGAFLVDACNEYGWGIPFTQITLHNAS